MSSTSTQSYGKGIFQMGVGSYIETGTAAAVTITTGFKPRYVKVMNEDGDAYMEWYEGMADAEAMKLVGDTTPAVLGKVTSNGITVSASGFIIGLDTDVNVASQQMSWLALG